jgi:hypothetical protein
MDTATYKESLLRKRGEIPSSHGAPSRSRKRWET